MSRRLLLVAFSSFVLLSACKKEGEAAKAVLPPLPARPAAAQGSLVVVGTLQALPGALPANDLYKYAYVMKYTVDTVVDGSFVGKEILVAQYDPRTPRASIQDEQKGNVGGNVAGFQAGDRHYLVLRPLDSAWTGAIEDGYPQESAPRWWASWSDRI